MNKNLTLEIKYHKIMPLLWFILGVSNLGLVMWGQSYFRLIFSLLFFALAYSMWNRPLCVITPDAVEYKNMLGETGKTYYYRPDQISIKNKSVYIDNKKVVSTWWADISIDDVSRFLEENIRQGEQ